MRHALSFIISVLIHVAIFSGIIWVANAKVQSPEPKLQAVNFAFGDLVVQSKLIPNEPLSSEPTEKVDPPEPIEQQPITETPVKAKPTVTHEKPIVPKPKPVVTPKKIVKSKKIKEPRKKKKIKKPKKIVKKTVKKLKKKRKKTVVKKTTQKKKRTKQVKNKNKTITNKKKKTKSTQQVGSTESTMAPTSPGKPQSKLPNSKGDSKKPGKKPNTQESAGNGQSNATYRSGLVSAISRSANRNYPKSAKRRRKQGIVQVRFSLSSSGHISGIKMVASSGNSDLDRAAVKALRRLGKYKPPPAGFPNTLTVPIRFSLK